MTSMPSEPEPRSPAGQARGGPDDTAPRDPAPRNSDQLAPRDLAPGDPNQLAPRDLAPRNSDQHAPRDPAPRNSDQLAPRDLAPGDPDQHAPRDLAPGDPDDTAPRDLAPEDPDDTAPRDLASREREVREDHDPDRALVYQIQSGQDLAFGELMARYKKPIINFIYRLVGNASDADDVAQETFVRIYRNLPKFKFRPGAKFSTWLFQAARNAAIDHLRRRKKIFQSLEKSHEKVPTLGKNPATDFQSLEIGEAVAAAVAQLPEDQRTAFILAEYHDMAYAEIAAVMDCSEKAVESRLYRAKQELRAALRHLLA